MSAVVVVPDVVPEQFSSDPTGVIRWITEAYARLLLVGFALMPAGLIAYLYFLQDPALKFEHHAFHIVAIAVATLAGGFVTYVSWRCYRESGEPLLRWMTLGFLGFTLIYVLHGVFTGYAHDNIWLFLLYGPVSRFVMAALLLAALVNYHRPPDPRELRGKPGRWSKWVTLFMLVNLAVALVAGSAIAGHPAVRLSMEGGALVMSVVNVAILLARRIRSSLMVIFAMAVTMFALSSLAFLLGRPWNHMWWLAHVIFAGAFFLLSYGVVQAFHTTRSFSMIYSHEQLMVRISEAMARTEKALGDLRRTNHTLERLAATDSLTGADNRRRFTERVEIEMERVKRGGLPFSVLALDLDNFKDVNDRHGHQVGDSILKAFVQTCLNAIRPYDGVARVGGEEFMVLLPKAALDAARVIAERLRAAVESHPFQSDMQHPVAVTVSIGVSQSGLDGDASDVILRAADRRLYDAKRQGRNRVVWSR